MFGLSKPPELEANTLPMLYVRFTALCGLLLLSLVSARLSADELRPFTSDGCSAFPDGTPKHKELWLKCCNAHDLDYWMGGTYEERRASDLRLKQCVSSVGEPTIAKAMLAGVTIGGSPFWPTSFRWGYGWSYFDFRGYKALSPEELETIRKSLEFAEEAQD